MSELLSVQIVSWNSADVIDACLAALAAQTSRQFEVIVVDNASADDTVARIESWRARLPHLHLSRQATNTGFCGGQNRATAIGTGAWVLFLNPDTALPSDFVERALSICSRAPATVGAVAPCILRPDGTIDSTGLCMDRLRRAYDRDRGREASRRYTADPDVFGCTGAVALLRRAMLADVALDGQILDEAIFAYYDDLDLAWRTTLRGWRCRYEPELLAVHGRAAHNAIRGLPGRTLKSAARRLTVRNRLLVMVRCDRFADLTLAAPALMAFEAARIGYLLLRAPDVLTAYRDSLTALRGALRARAAILGRATDRLRPDAWRVA